MKAWRAAFRRLATASASGGAARDQLGFGRFDLRGNALGGLATIARGLAAHQVIGLDGGRAFVDGQNLGIAVVLGRAGFFDEAHAAVHLHAQRGDFQAHLGAVALDQRHHVFVEGLVLLARIGIGVVVGCVVGAGAHAGHGAAAFGVGAHGHQHAAHIGVVDDGRSGGHGAIHRAALHAVFGELHGLLVGALGNRNALHAHAVARGVHHDEHVLQAAVFLAHQVANGATVVAILQHGGRAGLDAHLVFDGDAVHVVARTQASHPC